MAETKTADSLSQVQDAVDQLAHQFLACLYFLERHHNLEKLGPTDIIQEQQKTESQPRTLTVEAIPADEFRQGQEELARDLVYKEQQIEYLIGSLPGLENTEQDQERLIRELEEELKVAEMQRKEAVRERDEMLAKLDGVIRSIKRP
ncbi:mediator of RNA polymerase II transcription subunit 21 [Sporothrix brasiliensis 5110]|uniref:Mediator of RNA polymerase II transcription subunit 21 n=1 Tax=Sporothrix brasiliensis 5110 TaxID=1398154 RepID=A0A0C2ITP8_9PEZI|nr:mediator of RNA polymerase II transcription subunit 21 [Sporothrix brasiliensis 5110]KIH90145.1 mediator of RNA polymerase II transcription subunit 21 [Sporothrix brasiliensis 5110]